MLDKKEIQERVESSFKPYDCKVEFLPTYATYWEEIGIQLSDEDNKLRPFENGATRKAVEHDVDELIEIWREDAIAMGYQLDSL